MSNKVFGLVRVSSIGQSDNTSIKNQSETIRKYCDLYNLDLVEIVEEVYTGTTENRDGLNYLMDKVTNGECDTIVVFKIDRLMRDFRSGINYITDLIEHNCKIISTQEQIDTSSVSGKFFLQVLLGMSEMEKSTIVNRLKGGRQYRFESEGKLVTSRPPFGYKKSNDTITLDSENSKIVKLIFKLYNEYIDLPKHIRTRKITKSLERRNHTFNGKKFTNIHIRRIVSNPFYKGDISYGEMGVKKHPYPNIVSPRLFNKVSSTF
tara:strand:- start:912 stop:1700 length:789 start_codon:yes stop_codon:yes gene_type:complete